MDRRNHTARIRPLLVASLVVAALAAGCATNRPLGEQADDAGISAAIKAKYVADPEINPFNIDVDTNDGVVRLSGTVEDEATRREAVELANNTDGVRRVINEIKLGERGLAERVDDATITAAVKAKIIADPELNALNIDVDTQNGVVTLSGVVKDERHRMEAVELARRTDGVREVRNRLEVGVGS
jgi:hyperosmotically inducible protein